MNVQPGQLIAQRYRLARELGRGGVGSVWLAHHLANNTPCAIKFFIGPEEDLSEALRLMASHQVRRIPVVDEDSRLVGVLSQADVARGAKEKDVGQMVGEISQTPTGPRV